MVPRGCVGRACLPGHAVPYEDCIRPGICMSDMVIWSVRGHLAGAKSVALAAVLLHHILLQAMLLRLSERQLFCRHYVSRCTCLHALPEPLAAARSPHTATMSPVADADSQAAPLLQVQEEDVGGDLTPMPELQHNMRLLVDVAEADIRRLDARLRHEQVG